ncbi:hypothetical protein CPB83DRAFT_835397 [Crepidotus variabilis]|uniref:Uncharacterized protein n=1 Tax=Crepidotus variabilis TaxID=179855 RepID=A0A9P6EHQ7_9AGAR|nr:hypothetical protein CPB83DRAFT_835397 [Crepidotus variabilis]
MDTVPGLALVDGLPTFGLSATLSSLSSQLVNPSLWLTLLATLVILSSLRAAILFFRTAPKAPRKAQISIIPGVQEKKDIVSGNGIKGSSLNNNSVEQEKGGRKTLSSAFLGLIKWDSLPSLPLPRRGNGAQSMSETERGRWTSQPQSSRTQTRSGRPAFQHPQPAIYQSDVPVSMAKMIMSRHTFRRPSSRPPPVRNANAPQFQRKLPSMV